MLNAFRHHWNLHYLRVVKLKPVGLCSTPFGIIGIFTASGRMRLRNGLRAQRLSASLESSHVPRPSSTIAQPWCSTPFGIIGIFTELCETEGNYLKGAQRLSASLESSRPYPCPTRPGDSVLNAFRHHWNLHNRIVIDEYPLTMCSTPFGIIGIFTVAVYGYTTCSNRAQRLSASLESSLRCNADK
ncbi:MAG: hypothetical protein QOJ02_925 [Acidobacteriota bacterium]|nr:hypothetical protein [Acidobacteriota bacterium]